MTYEDASDAQADLREPLQRETVAAVGYRELVALGPNATLAQALQLMQKESVGCLVVVEQGTLSGIFTERDVLFRIVDRGRNPAALPIGEVMTADPETLSVRASVAYVLNKMSVGGFRHVPVVDDEHRPACVVSVRDVVEYLVSVFPREVLNLPTDLGQRSPSAREGA